ncbi:MAG: rod shape-determining protein MreD [Candidatus Binataceae bacterium]
MRLVALFAVLTLVALAIQTTASRWLPLSALVPDLVLVLAVDLGLRHRRALAPIIAFAMGYAMDAFSGSQLGVNTFAVTLTYLVAYEVGVHSSAGGPEAGAVLVFVAVLIQSLGGFLISTQFRAGDQLGALVPAALLQATVTAVIAPPIFGLIAGLRRMLGLGQERRTRGGWISRGV